MARLRSTFAAAAVLLGALACATPASAQADFSGHWAPLFHEDNPERLPGRPHGAGSRRTEGVAATAGRVRPLTSEPLTAKGGGRDGAA